MVPFRPFPRSHARRGRGTPRRRSSSVERAQAVADAAHRLERGRALAELAAEPADRDLDDVGAAGPRVTPDVAQQPLALDGLALAFLQIAEDVEFELGEHDAPSVEHELAAARVDDAVFGGLQLETHDVGQP